jgi:hypothetical protein
VNHIGPILTVSLMLYALGMCPFLISEHRRPQATLAWMLACIGEEICSPFCARPQELSNGVRALIHLGSAPMNGPTRTSGRIRTAIYGFDLKSSFFNKIQ